MPDDLLEVWEFPRGFDLASIGEIAQGRLTPPDFRAHLVSSRGDVLTVQLREGVPTAHVDLLLYVRGRGAFEVIRREDWPGRRVLLTLSVWPRRE